MSNYHVLMLSASKAGNSGYLTHAVPLINAHLNGIKEVLFIPYAGVSVSFIDYLDKVQTALPELNITSIHQTEDPVAAINSAKAVLVGGGNTFALLDRLYKNGVLEPLKNRLAAGLPYIGWSAGSNICGATIRTTNDMPIVEPPSFNALSVVPFQLNPHYTNYIAPGHNGETRDERLGEFTQLNPKTSVIGIQEGSALCLSENRLRVVGELPAFHFLGTEKTELAKNVDLTHLL